MSPGTLRAAMLAPFYRELSCDQWTVQDQQLRNVGMVRRLGGRKYQAIGGAVKDDWHGQFKSRREAALYLVNKAPKQ